MSYSDDAILSGRLPENEWHTVPPMAGSPVTSGAFGQTVVSDRVRVALEGRRRARGKEGVHPLPISRGTANRRSVPQHDSVPRAGMRLDGRGAWTERTSDSTL
jgi:hypothetical protein